MPSCQNIKRPVHALGLASGLPARCRRPVLRGQASLYFDMPQRFLRPGITTSARWNSVSFECQSFYIRIITHVDDFGCCDGRASVLWGLCFPVWNELNPEHAVNLQRIAVMLQQLAAACLIEIYESDGKKVLEVTQWQERVREGARRKWPAKDKSQRPAAIRSKSLPPSPSPSPSPSPKGGRQSGNWKEETIIATSIPHDAPLPPSAALKEVFDAWNANPLFPGCLVMSDKRRRFLQVRLHDAFFATNWKAALAKLSTSKFCLGNNDRGWRANFDWFIQPDTVAKIMEGKYENNGSTRSPGVGNNSNRNTGTLNEGKASQYRGVGKVV